MSDTLDDAWAAVEAALPKAGWPSADWRWVIPTDGWTISIRQVDSGDGYFEPHVEGFIAKATIPADDPLCVESSTEPDPIAALRALEAKLRELPR